MTTFDGFISRESSATCQHYLQTYRFQSGQAHYHLDYASRYQFTEPCELTSNVQPSVQLAPEKGFGKFCIAVKEGEKLLAKVNRTKITDAAGNSLAKIYDPTPWHKAVIRNILQGDPEHFQIRAVKGKTVLADIIEPRRKSRWPWPLSIIAALLSLFKSADNSPRLKVVIHSPDIDPRVVLVAATFLDSQKGSV